MSAARLSEHLASVCRIRRFFLAFIWCLSLMSGIFFSYLSRDILSSLMCTAPMCRTSIVSLGVIILFPLVLAACAAVFSVSDLVYLILCMDGISFGYCLSGSVIAFGSAGWLILWLLSFSKITLLIPRLYFFLKCALEKKVQLSYFVYLIIAVLIICTFDYFCISQFLMKLTL